MARANWASSAMLIWLLAADTALSHPKPAETETASFVTQYPPVPSNGRVLIPHESGVSDRPGVNGGFATNVVYSSTQQALKVTCAGRQSSLASIQSSTRGVTGAFLTTTIPRLVILLAQQ